ncbi:hypothetical protein, partial [Paenibacillus prosopidis]|uniref:hypothetical protein n=1 Tax=Paenibacillus prosopidis TaxID=630520 RepID=UPI001FE34A35
RNADFRGPRLAGGDDLAGLFCCNHLVFSCLLGMDRGRNFYWFYDGISYEAPCMPYNTETEYIDQFYFCYTFYRFNVLLKPIIQVISDRHLGRRKHKPCVVIFSKCFRPRFQNLFLCAETRFCNVLSFAVNFRALKAVFPVRFFVRFIFVPIVQRKKVLD